MIKLLFHNILFRLRWLVGRWVLFFSFFSSSIFWRRRSKANVGEYILIRLFFIAYRSAALAKISGTSYKASSKEGREENTSIFSIHAESNVPTRLKSSSKKAKTYLCSTKKPQLILYKQLLFPQSQLALFYPFITYRFTSCQPGISLSLFPLSLPTSTFTAVRSYVPCSSLSLGHLWLWIMVMIMRSFVGW